MTNDCKTKLGAIAITAFFCAANALNMFAALTVVWSEPNLKASCKGKSLLSWALTFTSMATITLAINRLMLILPDLQALAQKLKRLVWCPSPRQHVYIVNVYVALALVEVLRLNLLHISMKQPLCLPLIGSAGLIWLYNYLLAIDIDETAQ